MWRPGLAATLVDTIWTGGRQAQMFIEQDSRRIDVPAGCRSAAAAATAPLLRSAAHRGGSPTMAPPRSHHRKVEMVVTHVVGAPLGSGPRLSGTVGDSDEATVLAVLRRP